MVANAGQCHNGPAVFRVFHGSESAYILATPPPKTFTTLVLHTKHTRRVDMGWGDGVGLGQWPYAYVSAYGLNTEDIWGGVGWRNDT